MELITAVQQQKQSDETPFVMATYIRLTQDGCESEEADELIACCLANELKAMDKENRDFDIKRYEQLLTWLPLLPEN